MRQFLTFLFLLSSFVVMGQLGFRAGVGASSLATTVDFSLTDEVSILYKAKYFRAEGIFSQFRGKGDKTRGSSFRIDQAGLILAGGYKDGQLNVYIGAYGYYCLSKSFKNYFDSANFNVSSLEAGLVGAVEWSISPAFSIDLRIRRGLTAIDQHSRSAFVGGERLLSLTLGASYLLKK